MLYLVRRTVSLETVKALSHFHHEAQSGRAIGFVGAFLLEGQEYTIEIVGECKNVPGLMRGLVNEVDDHLGKLVHHEAR